MEEIRDKNESSKKYFVKLLSDLHSSSNSAVFKALSQLRVEAQNHKFANTYLCEINAFIVLVKFLKLPNDKILNLSLSILANSSLVDDCRKQICEAGVVTPLVSILKHIAQDSIQNRACRLAANLALSKDIALELLEHKVPNAITSIIDTSKSPGTHVSGIRALRIIFESYNRNSLNCSKTKHLMISECIKSVVAKLVSENKEVVQNCLKTIALFTEHNPSVCANQISSVEGNGYSILLSKLPDPLIYQIIYNLCRSRHGVTCLNECHAVQAIIKLLAVPENQKEKLLVYSLCLLCDECTGSMQLLTSDNGLNVFLCLLAQADTYSVKSKLYRVLLKFIFEPLILLKLTRYGLVKILINKLDSIISAHGKPHRSVQEFLKGEEKQLDRSLSLQNDPHLDFGLNSKNNNDKIILSSPIRSGASPYSSSSGSISPCHYSPRSLSPPLSDDSSPLAVYSPVCSISDDDIPPDAGDSDENDDHSMDNDLNHCGKLVTGDDNIEVNEIHASVSHETNPVHDLLKEPEREDASIVYILLKLSHIDASVDDLASERTVKILLKYLAQVRHKTSESHVVNFLRSLVKKEQYYCDLLNNQFVLEAHRTLCRPLHVKCFRCDELNANGEYILDGSLKLSEAGLGEGQMAHKLLTGSSEVRLQVALTIPLVLTDPSLLIKLLFKYKAMDLLIERLSSCNKISPSSVEDIAYSLKILFMTLKFENPQQKTTAQNRCLGCDVGKLRKESSIVFSLDDGTVVPANKTSLCNNSVVFDAMLNGNFKESEQHEVKICDVSEKCLQHFVKLIDTYCECILPDDVNVLLELISISDRYLVSKLMNNILIYVMKYILNYKNCEIIFKWAKECKLPFSETISNDVIKYIFTSKMSCKQLRKSLTFMTDGVHKDIFINDIIEMIKEALYRQSRMKFR